MQDIIQKLEIYGYLLLFFSSFGGSVLGILSAGVLSSLGKLDLIASILAASSGNICGSIILVFLAKYKKSFFKSRYARKITLVSLWLRRYGVFLIFANKYIYGFKTILPLVVGISSYPLKKFIFWNMLSAFFWGSLAGAGGFFASNMIIHLFEQWKHYPYIFPLCLLGLIGLFFLFKRKISKKNPNATLATKS